MNFDEWTGWIPFSELFEYHGLIAKEHQKTSRKVVASWKGEQGKLHRDNGFRLRSKEYSSGSFSDVPLEVDLKKLPCPLNEKDNGVYFIKVNHKGLQQWTYIGKNGGEQIFIYKRLIDHFTKIAGTFEFSTGYSDTKEFRKMREYFSDHKVDTSSPKFFAECVEIAFVKVKGAKKITEKVSKIEGMALQKYRDLSPDNSFPNLNSKDETIGMGGYENLF